MHSNLGPRGRALAALVAFAALALLLFWQLWAPNATDRLSIGQPDGDFARQFYPYRAFVAGAWGSGQVPVLNPHQYSGTPAWADPQQAVLYPWRVLQAPFALAGRTLPLWAVEAEAIAHVALAAWFTFLLLAALGARAPAAALGGITFGLGGYVTGYPVEQLAVLDTAVWIPATLWVTTLALRRSRQGDAPAAVWLAVAAGAAASMLVLAGHPQTAMYGAYAAAGYWLARGWRDRVRLSALAGLGLTAALVAVGLSAAQWLPTADLSDRVARDLSAAEMEAGFEISDIAQMVAPARRQVLDEADAASAPRGAGSWVPLFVGALALALIGWGTLRLREVRPWVAAAGAAWLVSLAGHTPLYDLLLRWLPGFALFRHHERAAVLFSLFLAVAAGLSVSRLLADPVATLRSAGRAVALAGGAVAVIAVLVALGADSDDARAVADALVLSALALGAGALVLHAGQRGGDSERFFGWALVAIAALELLSVNYGRALGPRPVLDQGAESSILGVLSERAREGRVSSEALLPGGPNAASIWRLYDTTGDSPMHLRRHAAMIDELDEMTAWRLQAVRFAVSDRAFPPDAPVSELAADGDVKLYEVLLPAPQTWVPTEVLSLEPAEGASGAGADAAGLAELRAPQLANDPNGRVFVPELVAEAYRREADAGQEGGSGVVGLDPGRSELVGLDPGRAVTNVWLEREAVVVLSTTYDPGWRATARPSDGSAGAQELDVMPANGVLCAALVPAGQWRIEWTYRPAAVEFGFALSGATLLLAAVVALVMLRRRRARSPAT